jgi:hypothetical protein
VPPVPLAPPPAPDPALPDDIDPPDILFIPPDLPDDDMLPLELESEALNA